MFKEFASYEAGDGMTLQWHQIDVLMRLLGVTPEFMNQAVLARLFCEVAASRQASPKSLPSHSPSKSPNRFPLNETTVLPMQPTPRAATVSSTAATATPLQYELHLAAPQGELDFSLFIEFIAKIAEWIDFGHLQARAQGWQWPREIASVSQRPKAPQVEKNNDLSGMLRLPDDVLCSRLDSCSASSHEAAVLASLHQAANPGSSRKYFQQIY